VGYIRDICCGAKAERRLTMQDSLPGKMKKGEKVPFDCDAAPVSSSTVARLRTRYGDDVLPRPLPSKNVSSPPAPSVDPVTATAPDPTEGISHNAIASPDHFVRAHTAPAGGLSSSTPVSSGDGGGSSARRGTLKRALTSRRSLVRAPEPTVAEQLEQHQAALAAMRAALAAEPLFDATRHDGLWLLRFLLSSKLQAPKAADGARTALALRQKLGLDDMKEMVTTGAAASQRSHAVAERGRCGGCECRGRWVDARPRSARARLAGLQGDAAAQRDHAHAAGRARWAAPHDRPGEMSSGEMSSGARRRAMRVQLHSAQTAAHAP
ncbi:hypothetical protein OAO87_04250, partial [bacterium]|nr:hypothetical protein [bacterium]